MSDNAFTKIAAANNEETPADFDVDAWLTGATLPERTVTIYGDGKGYADLQEAIADFDRARADEANVAEEDAGLNDGAATRRLAERVEQLRDQIEASKRTFRFRAIVSTESEEIGKAHKGDDDAITYATIAKQSVRPKLTPEQVKAMRGKIGEGQFQKLMTAAAEASYGRQVEVPFSLAASALLATRESSSK
jgi:hypothetical protein